MVAGRQRIIMDHKRRKVRQVGNKYRHINKRGTNHLGDNRGGWGEVVITSLSRSLNRASVAGETRTGRLV